MNRQAPPMLGDVEVTIAAESAPSSVGWASPDVDDGRYHALQATVISGTGRKTMIFVE